MQSSKLCNLMDQIITMINIIHYLFLYYGFVGQISQLKVVMRVASQFLLYGTNFMLLIKN